jgi:hypothetical protein
MVEDKQGNIDESKGHYMRKEQDDDHVYFGANGERLPANAVERIDEVTKVFDGRACYNNGRGA